MDRKIAKWKIQIDTFDLRFNRKKKLLEPDMTRYPEIIKPQLSSDGWFFIHFFLILFQSNFFESKKGL
jgi:hypothetical protein